ncbi:DUF4232 domain-containing protein [Candidatus Solirubrobacter pratensis]|uniref:DUF4232 domain-containing protein n=1 Tax=Candidatus Solirubrobacter pratensis TaxID=1298857 RepID=UPI0004049AD4|nr:DUF4232 domain-containing protein [Candidatus Solirubrobacter pratensis]
MTRRIVAAAALVLAGCGGGGGGGPAPAVKGSPELVPFEDALPAALTRRPPAPAPACRASQLKVAGNGVQFVPGTQQGGIGSVVVRNGGTRPCRLTGRPEVRFVGGTAPPRQRQRALAPDAPAFPKVAPPAASLLALQPGQSAALTIDWENWCPQSRERANLQPPKALRVTLPGGRGSVDVKYNAVVSCDHQDRPSVIGVRPFAPEPLAESSGFTTAPMTASVHPLGGGKGALRGRRGQVLRFAVELRNASRTETVSFGRCPLVAEKFAPVGATEAHQLNCAAAAPIKPKQARWFEMRVRVPAKAPLGANGLFWRLDPEGEFAPQVVARVVVAP